MYMYMYHVLEMNYNNAPNTTTCVQACTVEPRYNEVGYNKILL